MDLGSGGVCGGGGMCIVNLNKSMAPKALYNYSASFGTRNFSISRWETREVISIMLLRFLDVSMTSQTNYSSIFNFGDTKLLPIILKYLETRKNRILGDLKFLELGKANMLTILEKTRAENYDGPHQNLQHHGDGINIYQNHDMEIWYA